MTETYKPTLKSVRKHQAPEWFHDAKFGIFIHWSLSSVPAFAPVGEGDIVTLVKKHGWEYQYKHNAYAEWYLNSIKIEGSPAQLYHHENYGKGYSYDNFVSKFNKDIESWDPEAWAELFKNIGAQYVVLVTKHHDGFLLWPSERPNPYKEGYHAARDIVGELTRAVKSRDMRMGFYYSGALDWTFNESPITDVGSFITNGPVDKEYIDYVDSHFRELIDKYQPSILWNDIGYPPGTNVNDLFAYFYNKTPEGLVNDRWMQIPKNGRKLITSWPIINLIEWSALRTIQKKGLSPPPPPHSDYSTPEYTTFSEISKRKWECVRGIGHSFGYNQMEDESHYLKVDEAVKMLVDIVSKNGNLLLNVGPMSDGTIPKAQVELLKGLGRWLEVNGEAIYGTRPWLRAEGATEGCLGVRFTKKGDVLYAILLDAPGSKEVVIKNLKAESGAKVRLLGCEGELEWTREGDNLKVNLPGGLKKSPAISLAVSQATG